MNRRRSRKSTGIHFSRWWYIFIILFICLGFMVVRLPLLRLLVQVSVPEQDEFVVTVQATGFTLYQETQLVSPLSGQAEAMVSEGDMVPRGKEVVSFSDTETSAAYQNRLKQVSDQLVSWYQQNIDNIQTITEEKSEHGTELTDLLLDMKKSAATGESKTSSGRAGKLAAASSKYVQAHLETQSLLDEWNQRCDQFLTVNELLRETEGSVIADRPGVVLFGADGLENILRWEINLDRDLVDILLEWSPQESQLSEPEGVGSVTAGEPVVRIVEPDKLDAVMLVSSDKSSMFMEGNVVDLKADDAGQPIEAEIVDVEVSSESSALIRVSLKQMLPFFYHHRRWSAQMRKSKGTGKIIDTSKLITRDGRPGVYTWQDSQPKWKEVEVLFSDNEVAVVSGLARGVPVVSNPHLVILLLLG